MLTRGQYFNLTAALVGGGPPVGWRGTTLNGSVSPSVTPPLATGPVLPYQDGFFYEIVDTPNLLVSWSPFVAGGVAVVNIPVLHFTKLVLNGVTFNFSTASVTTSPGSISMQFSTPAGLVVGNSYHGYFS